MADNAEITNTDCCALFQISGISNHSSLEDIQEAIDEIKEDEDLQGRAIFVITQKHEDKLVKNLKKLGFKEIAKFARKYIYEQTGLTMWLKKLNYKKEYNAYLKNQELKDAEESFDDEKYY